MLSGFGPPHARAPADAEVEHAPQLLLVDVAGEPAEDERALPRVPLDLCVAAGGEDALEVAGDAAARHVRESEGAAAQPPGHTEVERRRCEQVGAVVVLLLEDAADERKAIGVDAGRREAEDDVARLDPGAVDQRLAVDASDTGRCEVELALLIHVRHLRRLAADQRDTRRAADLRRALDELSDLLELDPGGGDIVEQHERLGAAGDDVVDAVRSHVGAAVAQQAAGTRDHRLRADGVRRGGKQARLVERMECREGAEALRPRRFDRGAQPFDDRPGRGERNAGRVVRALLLAHGPSLWVLLDEQLAEELRPALRAAADEADDGFADLHAGSVAGGVEDLREGLRLARRVVRLEVQLRKPQRVALREELVDPLARRVELEPVAGVGGGERAPAPLREDLFDPPAGGVGLEPVAGVGGDERAPAAMLLDPKVVLLRARYGGLELVLVEHETEVVDPRCRPLARLDDDVHRALLELGQPELEAQRVELAPGDPRLVRRELLADPPVASDELERELADVARLDLANAARDEVIVEELHRRPSCRTADLSRGARRRRAPSRRSSRRGRAPVPVARSRGRVTAGRPGQPSVRCARGVPDRARPEADARAAPTRATCCRAASVRARRRRSRGSAGSTPARRGARPARGRRARSWRSDSRS